MTFEKKHRVLVDLYPTFLGYSGIPQESRLLFKTFSHLKSTVEAGGFLYSNNFHALHSTLDNKGNKQLDVINCANVLEGILLHYDESHQQKKNLIYYIDKIMCAAKVYCKRSFNLKEIDTSLFFDFIWRACFSKTLTQEDFLCLAQERFYLSTLSTACINFSTRLNFNLTLDTRGWDFVIFQFQRSIKVSPGTTKIIRYHDSIALQDVDVAVPDSFKSHQKDMLRCVPDSYYVCNSEPTREILVKINPELENRSSTICPIITDYKKVLDKEALLKIFKRSFSSELISREKYNEIYQRVASHSDFRYLLMLSTLEPRKNFLLTIRAWERFCAKTKLKLHLVIVGNRGWKSEETLAAMQPHVLDGEILHLEKIRPDELSYLYSHAEALIFPSFNEGLGIPPLEAMQCECPVIASDIKTHRWVYADAALYCNPYSVDSLVDKLEQLFTSSQSPELRLTLIQNGLEQIQRYNQKRIGEQWSALFENLKKS